MADDVTPATPPPEPELVLEGAEFLPAEDVAGRLEHVRKWPAENWTLAFQGQLRTISEADARVLVAAMERRRVGAAV